MNRAILIVISMLAISGAARAQSETELLQRLAQGDHKVIPAIVKRGEGILPELTKLLRKAQREEKALIAFVIGEIASKVGPKANGAIPDLCEAIRTKDRAVAAAAVQALGFIGPEAAPDLVKTLRAVSKDRAAVFPLRGLLLLKRTRDAVPDILATLQSNADGQVRMACIHALGAAGSAGKAGVKDLLTLAEEDKKSSYYKAHVIAALGEIGPEAKEAIPFLARTLESAPEPHYRIMALDALAAIQPDSRKFSGMLVKLLTSPDVPRIRILESLNKTGPLAKEDLKPVEELLRDKDSRTRLLAAMVVGKVNRDHPAVVSILIESLQEREARMRLQAAQTIGALLPTDEAVHEALVQHAEDSDMEVRQAVAEALARYKKK